MNEILIISSTSSIVLLVNKSPKVIDLNNYEAATYDYNMPRKLTLLGSGIYANSGYSIENKKDDNKYEYNFSNYRVVFLKIDQDKLYNINDYTIYYNDFVKNQDSFASNPEIKQSLKKALEYKGIPYKPEMTIPKILKLQKQL